MTHRHKTQTSVNVPLLKVPQMLLKKYEGTLPDSRLLPVLSNQKLNSYLKEIADLCGIEKNITFHLARHTFATVVKFFVCMLFYRYLDQHQTAVGNRYGTKKALNFATSYKSSNNLF